MKKIFLSLLCFVTLFNLYSQEVEWVTQLDQTSAESGQVKVNAIATDKDGNIFITGNFEGVVDFNPSAAGGDLTSYYGSWYSEDPYVAKYDANGNFLWAQHIVSAQGLGAGNALAVDAAGNVYVSGEQYAGELACFLARYTAAGVQTYYYTMKGYESTTQEGSIALDESGNLYFFNRFTGTNVDLDPTAGSTLKTAVGGYDAYIAKFTASTGAFQWVKTFGGTGYEECYDIETDGTYLYVTGGFYNTVDFNPDAGVNNLTSVGNTDIFLASYLCSTGAYNYAYSFGGAQYERGYNIELDGTYMYFATQYTGTIDFQQGSGTYYLTSASSGTSSSVALLRLKNSDLTVSWGYNLPFNVQRPSMSLSNTQILIASTVPTGTQDFDPGSGTTNITSNGWTGAVLSLNSDQSFNWAVRACEPASASYYKSVEADITNGFFFGTDFSISVNVDPDGNSTPLTEGSYGDDGFISHWITCIPVAITTQPTPASSTICQGNSVTYSVTATGTGPISYQWYNGAGAISGQTGSSYTASASGSYYCIVTNACGTETSNTVNLTVTPYPSNDNCANAINISSLPYNSGVMSNNCASNDIPAGSGCSGYGANVWFKFTGTGNRMLISTDNAGTNFDTELHIYTGSCGAMTEVECDDDDGSGTTSLIYLCSAASTTYYVSVGYYNSSLIYGNYQLTVIDYPVGTPTAISASPSAICNGSSSTLSATPGTNGEQVHWYTGSCGGTYVNTGNSISVSPTSNTTYYARTYDTDCSMYSTSCATVSVSVKTDVGITSATAAASPICPSSTTTITANGVTGTNAVLTWWTGAGGTGSNLGSSNPLTVGPGTYYARVTGDCGGPVEASVTVASKTISVDPTSATASPSSVCSGVATNITLTASGGTVGTGAVVQWYKSSCGGTLVGTGNPLVVSQTLSSTTTYYARYSGDCNTTGCISTSVNIKTNVGITSATATASPICSSSTTTVTANGVTGTNAVLTWWTGSGGTGTNLGSSNPLTVGPGTYYARVTGDCGSAVEASVTVAAKTNSVAPVSATASPASVCSGVPTNITLTASGGTLGTGAVVQWYTSSCGGTLVGTGNPLVVSQTLASATTYYARYSGDCNTTTCTSTTVSVNTNAGITSATAAASPICSSSTTTITANGITGTNATLTWWTGSGGTGTNLGSSNPLTVGPGTYYARVTGDCGGAVEASVSVAAKINSVAPSSATASPASVCSGVPTNITLTASGGTLGTGAVVQWYTSSCGGTLVGTGNPLVVSQTLASATTYYARYSGDCNTTTCTSTTVNISTGSGITSATASVSPICSSSSTTVTANGISGTNAVLTWWTGTGGTGTNLGPANPLTVGPGTYYARVTSDCGSPAEASVTVSSKTNSVAPTLATANPSTVCSGVTTNITLTASGGTAGTGAVVQWYTTSCGGTLIGTGNPLVVSQTLTSNTTYYARYSGDCNTTTCTGVTVSVDALPTATAGGSQTICPDASAIVSGATYANGTISWTENGAGSITAGSTSLTPEYTAGAADAGTAVTLTLTVTSNNTCAPQTATATYTVNVSPLPATPSFASSDRNNFCNDDAGTINLTVAGGSGDNPVWFTTACGGTNIGTGNPLNIESPSGTTTYYVRWENSCGVSACTNTVVTVVDPPVEPTSATSDINNFCADDAGNISLSVAGGSGSLVQWFTGSCGGSSAGTGNPLVIPSPETTTTYYARWENTCGNTTCVSYTVTVNPLPVAPISALSDRNDFCADDAGNIELSATGGSGEELHWYTGSCGDTPVGTGNPLTIESPEENTIYYARWENSCGVSSCAFVIVNVITQPVAPTFVTSDGNNLCVDDAGTINLSAVGGSGTTIRWFTDACEGTEIGTTNPLNIESPAVTTEYFARWENSCGVSACESVTINIIDSPSDPVSAEVDQSSVCSDDTGNISLSLIGGTGPQVFWYSGSCGVGLVGTGNPLVIPSPTVNTTYYGRYESSCGNSECASVSVSVSELPQPPVSAQTDINNFCSSDSGNINLSVTGGSGENVYWFTESCGGTPVGSGNPLTIESPEVTTTYYGRWENTCGVTVCQNVTVTVLPSADATINPVEPLCVADDPLVITAAQVGGTWSGDAINPSTGFFDPEIAGAGDHTITYTISGTCGDTDEITVNVAELFDATINPVAPMCSNAAPITLTAATAGGTWAGNGITDADAGIFNPGIAGAGNHTIIYSYSGLCGSSDNITISVVQKADATINAAGPFCVTGGPVVITALQSGGTWSGDAINPATGLFDPETAGVGDHTITYVIPGDCGDIKDIVITVLPPFDATITQVPPMCSGDDEIILTAATTGGTWTGNGITNSETGTFDPGEAGAGNHVINYSYSGTCGSSDDITIVVSPSADATITPAGPFCRTDDPVVLSAAQIGGTWSGTAVNPANGFFDPETAGTGNHTITYTITGTCGDSDEIILSVLDLFDATITSKTVFCNYEDSIILTANTEGGTWTGTGVNELTGALFIPDAGTGVHQVIYSYNGLCGDSDTVYLTINSVSDATITPVDSLYEDDEPVIIHTANSGGIWSGTGIDASGIFDPEISGVGEFEIIYTIDGLCGDSDTSKIIVLKTPIADLLVPTVITPDADGYNDRWKIQGIEAYDNVSIRIFTRWGDEVFVFDGTGIEYADPVNQWDGKRKDKELPSGSYVFILIVNNDDTHKGTISLIR